MTAIGVGFTVALGVGIGARLAAPGLDPVEAVVSVFFWGMLAGFLFHIYEFALRGVRGPFGRR